MDRHILQSREVEGSWMGVLSIMAHQRSAPPLLMVELAPREAVIDQQQRTLFQPMSPFGRPGAYGKTDFAFKTRRQIALRANFFGGLEQGATRRAFVPHEPAGGIATDTAFIDAILPPGNNVRWHGIEQFIGDNDAGKFFRQTVEPRNAADQVRGGRGNMLLLPLAE